MKKKLLFIPLILGSISLVSCNNNSNDTGNSFLAVFYLEGGSINTAQNEYISYRYELDDPQDTTFIGDPTVISEVGRLGYTLEGWYKNRTANGTDSDNNPIYTYTDKFDFQTEKVGIDGITLYASWVKDAIYTYSVRYVDEGTSEEVVLGSYTVSSNAAFNDYYHYNNDRDGYTAIDYYSDKELTTLWDSTYRHPGGDESLDIPVYVKYYPGDYIVVNTIRNLRSAGDNNIYLNADLDFEGADFAFQTNYTHTFLGNGHTISNFKVNYSRTGTGSLNVGFFRSLEGATINDLTLKDYSVDVDISGGRLQELLIGPLAGDIRNSTIDNVDIVGFEVNVSSTTTVPVYYQLEELGYVVNDSNITNCEIDAKANDLRPTSTSLFIADLNEFKYKFERRNK